MAKKSKICKVCGRTFLGTEKAECCGATCRKKLSRLLKQGKQPQFRLIGGKNSNKKPTIVTNNNLKEIIEKVEQEVKQKKPVKEVDPMSNTFWTELRKKKLGLK